MPHLLNATFYTSAHERWDLPKHSGIEIAFSGRSNAGKSSVINTLTNRNHLAFVSKTPGRTQLINFFQLASNQFLVDLPGYGYAKVPEHVRQHWKSLLSNYLQTRTSLKGLILVMDIRHPLKPHDIQMLDWFSSTGKVIHILLTKADKLSKLRANITLQKVALFLKEFYPQCSVQLFSSITNIGVDDAMTVITEWLRIN
ncbi:ribosome biogenesis GTP-binding protein YihA/YsxC [Nitrosomonas ureae]|uniref:Probable GTP-binding protein EngB n=1 Tax=Nitrosomonas ureae TaxID=44577 RepID=A0A1H9DLG2_9PROT|nr:ribosome biogenesis GTP-binding protein YihA/YsxC [Nitrosomonas ureae]PTQ83883.1 cell division checkpoint GTPase YihA [Nitrosomonas ureae]PXX15493.1 cell division checkpoint GTPase YihA [Nitrosomonas ureae]SEQ14251.1 GTP-binding protein [Nitrosomonas ureae]SOD21201.1 cell division checkpoint GTPase YihA [Nitrosomonas ureae]